MHDTFPARGAFDWATLVGTLDPDPAGGSHRASQFGLIVDGSYVYGTFRDGAGRMYCIARRMATAGDTAGLMLMDDRDGNDLRIDARSSGAGFVGRVQQHVSPGRHEITGGKAYPHGPRSFGITLTTDDLAWDEGDVLSLRCRIVGPGLQWYTPWPGGGALYASRLFAAEGSIGTETVRGFVGFDQFNFPPGMAWGQDPFVRAVELNWHTFGNLYEDGSLEIGHIACGHGRWGFALVNAWDADGSPRQLLCTTEVESEITKRDDEGWALHIVSDVAGEQWEWLAEDTGRMPDFGPRENPQQEGLQRRVGDDRRPVAWMAWGETCPTHGDRRGPAPAWP